MAVDLAWEYAARQFAPPPVSPYLGDPVRWMQERRRAHLWSMRREIAQSIADHEHTAVKSCHDAGQSWIAAQIAAYWIDVHPPGEAFVVSRAPTYAQVHAILRKEIRKAAKNPDGDPLPGRGLQSDEWKLDDGTLVGGRQ
ncbi:hypothetical protein [Actinomadura fibrosa]|uniref:Uncharacterized protein n=1 Tax=Actinomadura fibrosa TaxID=111802 RepID=A0ABW2XP68_9ACTN|nr:hypothetical protein [Actinomadura fibrosa]